MTDDRSAFTEAREVGLQRRHETREARAVRKQVAEEIAAALMGCRGLHWEDRERAAMGDARQAAVDALIEAGFVDPDDGTVPHWYKGEPVPVWTVPARIVDHVLAAALPHLNPELPDGYDLVERFWGAAWPTLVACEIECGTCKPCVAHWAVTWSLAALSNPALVAKAEQDGAWQWTTKPIEPTFTASEVKELTTKTTAVALALGRREAGEEIAAALEAIPGTVYPEDIFPPDGTSVDAQSARVMRFAYPAAARIARDVVSQDPEDAPEPRTAPTGHSDLPPAPEAVTEACPEYYPVAITLQMCTKVAGHEDQHVTRKGVTWRNRSTPEAVRNAKGDS